MMPARELAFGQVGLDGEDRDLLCSNKQDPWFDRPYDGLIGPPVQSFTWIDHVPAEWCGQGNETVHHAVMLSF